MKYALATLACVGLVMGYCLIGGMLSWQHGGGILPMMILFAAVGAVWKKIAKSKAH